MVWVAAQPVCRARHVPRQRPSRNLGNPHYGEPVYLLLSALPLLVMILTLADVITGGEERVRHLNRTFWIIIVILLPVVGSILWWTIGREYPQRSREMPASFGDPRRTERVERELATRSAASTEAQLARLDAEIAEAEAAARIRRLEAELAERRRGAHDAGEGAAARE